MEKYKHWIGQEVIAHRDHTAGLWLVEIPWDRTIAARLPEVALSDVRFSVQPGGCVGRPEVPYLGFAIGKVVSLAEIDKAGLPAGGVCFASDSFTDRDGGPVHSVRLLYLAPNGGNKFWR